MDNKNVKSLSVFYALFVIVYTLLFVFVNMDLKEKKMIYYF